LDLETYKSLELIISEKAKMLEEKILHLNFSSLNISEYSKLYWIDNLRKLSYIMKSNAFILFNAIIKSKKEIKDIVLMDNGGGTGSLSLLAKAIGINTVIYNDIYDLSCNDALIVAEELGFKANDYVCADSEELINYFANKKLDCDIVVSRNVIEHIYNLEKYFADISKVSRKALVVCFATTANIKNPLVNLYTRKIQKRVELFGNKGKYKKERDSTKSFFEIRKQIIKDAFPNLVEDEIVQLSKSTRGLKKEDIIDFIGKENYHDNYRLLPKDSRNTCDPITGNRSENLLSLNIYKNILEKNGFKFQVIPGFYNTNYKLKILNLITPSLNRLINSLKLFSIFLSPFIIILGVKKADIE